MAEPSRLSEVERLRLVIETQRLINAVLLDIDQVMAVVAEQAQVITGAGGGVVELVEGTEMVYRAASGAAADFVGTRLNRDGSISGLCVREGVPLLCEDSESDPRVDSDACHRIGVRSMVVVPLFHGPEPVGVLKVMSRLPKQFDDVDVQVLQTMAGFIGDALANASSHGALGYRAMHDHLTRLPNRALLMDRLEQAIRRVRRTGDRIAVFFIDLDGFKRVNDTLGHGAGDEVLRATATELSAMLRVGDTLARFGGDEFVLVCENVEDGVEEAMRRRIATAIAVVRAEFHVPDLDASVGFACSDEAGWTADELLATADASMYRAKRGRHEDEVSEGF